ncbi:MAG: carboxypeptidase regulatory-like domain-containing protein [Acidobacteria bacterium]|nr:carboxypeptidase regulatory-like domain-containing protein [Acidobacteriota bacterium]
MKDLGFKILGVTALLTLFSLMALAQVSSTSALSGAVTDPNGAVVAGAEVKVKNDATGAEFNAVTASNGTFRIPALAAGNYTVTINSPGFKRAVIQDVKLDAATPSNVNVVLEVGAQSESVVIQGTGEVLQTQSANISTTITGRQITELPFASRDALDLVLLLPGTSTPGRPRTSTVNGLPKGALNITMDGINIQDNTLKSSDGFFTYIRPRIDAVEEVTVSTATPGAESSGEGAVQIKFVTKSGNNDYHGSLYEYHRNPVLNSNYWFNNRANLPRARVLLNQFGGRVGGPISIPKVFSGKDRAFFFVNYEEYRLPEQATRQRTILNPLTQTGLFQYNTSNGVRSVNLLQMAANQANCSACTATLDPTVSKLLADIRQSTTTTGTIEQLSDPNLQRYTFTNSGSQRRTFTTVRFDFNLSSKHHLENIYNYDYFGSTVDFLNSRDPVFPGFPNKGSQISNRFSNVIALRSTLTNTLVNEARFGLTGGTVLFFPEASPADFNGPIANQQGFALSISAAGITNAHNTTAPSRRNAPVWQFSDTLNWTRGAHSLSFGFSFTHISSWSEAVTLVPSITFGIDTNDPANAMFTTANFPGAATADITRARNIYAVLTGHVTAISANARLDETTGKYKYLGTLTQRYRQRESGFFAQDTWRVRQNLTLTGGLRWEVQYPFVAASDVFSQVTFNDLFGISGPGNLFKPGTTSGRESEYTAFAPGSKAFNTDYNNLAPSVGISWSPNWHNGLARKLFGEGGQTVFRGGYSIAFNREGMNVFSSIYGANPGATISANRNLTLGNLGTLPLLLRETNRLGAPGVPDTPAYPNTGLITDSVNTFNPDLGLGYVQSWTFGMQREITKDTVVELRYVGNRGVKQWQQYNLNEVNLIENGFLKEFRLAQANLQANLAQGRGANFRYYGPGTGTAPLPIILAHFSGVPMVQAGDAAKYGSSQFASTTFVNALAANNPAPGTFAGFGTGLGNFITNATFRNNALNAGLPANFFLLNPSKQGGAWTVENNGRSYYDAAVVELRRRMSKGLLVQGSYTFARNLTNMPVSSSAVAYQPRTLRNLSGDRSLSPFGITHALKLNWIYDLPFGKGKAFGGGVGRLGELAIGGWEFHGTARIQTGSPNNFGNVRLIGMTRNELQKALKIRKEANFVYYLPQDIIDNTIRANNVSATSATGYSSQGVPTGRYIAPASSPGCLESFPGECGTSNLVLYGPSFTRFDLSVVKKFKFTERVNFEFRAEFLNAFNNINFLIGSAGNDVTNIGGFGSATFGQTANAYQDTSTTNDPGGRLIQFVARLNF